LGSAHAGLFVVPSSSGDEAAWRAEGQEGCAG